jgi:hypothetical protein
MPAITAHTARRIRRGFAVAVTLAAVAPAAALAGPASASTPAPAAQTERVTAQHTTKSDPAQGSAKAAKRQLKQAGMKAHNAPSKAKKMRRGFCTFTFYFDGVIAECTEIGGAYGWYTNVFFDSYYDNTGWIYWGWYF